MAAPSLGSVQSAAQTTGLTNNASAPATVNADDIIIRWAVCQNVADPATAFTWPAGFTEIIAVQILDDTGAHIGLAGLAWKRAVGNEDGTTLAVTRNGSGGTSSCHLGGSFTIVGCETSGDPYDVVESSAPTAASPCDFPSITTLTAESFIITGMLKAGENDNYATPSGWTVISSNGGTGGTDSSADWDYRVANTVGTFDPTSPTVTIDEDTAYALFQIAFIPPGAAGSLAVDKAGTGATVPGADLAASGSASLSVDAAGVAATVPGADVAAGTGLLEVDVAGVGATVPGADLAASGSVALAVGLAGTAATVPGADLAASGSAPLAVDVAGTGATIPGADLAASGSASLAVDVAGTAATVPGADLAASGSVSLAVDVAGTGATVPGADPSEVALTLSVGVAGTGATIPGADVFIRGRKWAVAEFAATASSAEFSSPASVAEFEDGAPAVAEFAFTSRLARYASPTRLVEF